jgi:hypothetical protein
MHFPQVVQFFDSVLSPEPLICMKSEMTWNRLPLEKCLASTQIAKMVLKTFVAIVSDTDSQQLHQYEQ